MKVFLLYFILGLSSCTTLSLWHRVPILDNGADVRIKGENIFFCLGKIDTLINEIRFHRYYYFDNKDTIITRFGIRNDTVYICPYNDLYSEYNSYYPFFYLPSDYSKIPEQYIIEINTSREDVKRQISCLTQLNRAKNLVEFKMFMLSTSSHPKCDFFVFQVCRRKGIVQFEYVSPDNGVLDFIPFGLKPIFR